MDEQLHNLDAAMTEPPRRRAYTAEVETTIMLSKFSMRTIYPQDVLRRIAALSLAGMAAYWSTFAPSVMGEREHRHETPSGFKVVPISLSM